MTDDLGRQPIPGVASASRCRHLIGLLTPIRRRKYPRVRQVDGAVDTMCAQCMSARGYRVPGFSPSPDSPGYKGELPGPAAPNGVPNSNPLMGSRNRDHTVCFIVALIRCNADTPVLTNRAVLRMPVPCGSARLCAVASRTTVSALERSAPTHWGQLSSQRSSKREPL